MYCFCYYYCCCYLGFTCITHHVHQLLLLHPNHPHVPHQLSVVQVAKPVIPEQGLYYVCSSIYSSSLCSRPPTNPREDVLLVWKELEEARNILADVQAIQLDRTTSLRLEQPNYIPPTPTRDEYLSSQEWIAVSIIIIV